MHIDLNRFRETFFEEAMDHHATLEAGLLRLEKEPGNHELLDAIFRAAHTIKGSSGTLGFEDVSRFTHALETVLDPMREGKLVVTPEVMNVLLAATDVLGGLLATARDSRAAPTNVDETIALLHAVTSAKDPTGPTVTEAQPKVDRQPRLDYFKVTFQPKPDFFHHGMDPLLLLRDLARLGSILEVRAHTERLPDLGELEPEQCYLGWSVLLRTHHDMDAVRDVFCFVADDCSLDIAPAQAPVGRASFIANRKGPMRPAATARFFGAHLADRGLVTREQIIAALEGQKSERIPLGKLALRERLLTVHEVFDVMNWSVMTGTLFSEAAIELGVLQEAQVARLLELQRQTDRSLEEILVSTGVVDRAVMEAELKAFHGAAAPVLREPAPVSAPASPLNDVQIEDENREMLAEFVVEADEHLEASDRLLLALESSPLQQESLNALYRAFHSIKGISSFFSLEDMTGLAHAAEDVLNGAREGRLTLKGALIDVVFKSVDALKRQVELLRKALASDGILKRDPQVAPLIAALHRANAGEEITAAEVAPVPSPASAATPPPTPAPRPGPARAAVAKVEPGPSDAPEKPQAAPPPPGDRAERETVRVDRDRLDKLVNIIGELVIGQSILEQELASFQRDTGHQSRAVSQLTKIVRDLQEMSLSLRMVPIGATFQRMARIVRDLGRKLNKQIVFETEGEETELDKTVVDHIGDPLMHMVRNAADHGIELPDDRVAAGKPAQGRIKLRAFHQGGNIYIELQDDGKGLNRAVILRKAVERGLVREGDSLSDNEICNLIFLPGFSTAQQVTDVSGRGVGMDVVRKNVEALQGSVSVRSEQGKGSVVTIRLPLTLAILDGLHVAVNGECYILPLVSVVESFRPQPSEIRTVAGRGEVVLVRGDIVPLFRLYRLLNIPAGVTDPCQGLVVIVGEQGKKCGLLIDELVGQQQVVIKNLEANFQKVDGIAGATILGDGRVALILDVYSLTRLATRSPMDAGGRALAREVPEQALDAVGAFS